MEQKEPSQNGRDSSVNAELWEAIEAKNEGEDLMDSYSQFVMLLDADESLIEEAFLNASNEQLLRCIEVYDDQLHDYGTEHNQFKKLVYLRHMAVINLRRNLNVDEENRHVRYDPLLDPALTE